MYIWLKLADQYKLQSSFIPHGLDHVFLVLAHENHASTDSCEFLLQDVGALSLSSGSFLGKVEVLRSEVLEGYFLERPFEMRWLQSVVLMVVQSGVIPWVEFNIDFPERLARGLFLQRFDVDVSLRVVGSYLSS